jgi:hypothetical protein
MVQPQQTAQELIALVRSRGESALDPIAGVDDLADAKTLGDWLGIGARTIHRARGADRVRADGRSWPEPDEYFGRTPVWRYRTIIIYRAGQPARRPRGQHRKGKRP